MSALHACHTDVIVKQQCSTSGTLLPFTQKSKWKNRRGGTFRFGAAVGGNGQPLILQKWTFQDSDVGERFES